MVTIKIISNPYRRETSFQKYNEVSDEWTDIRVNNPNSKLLSEDIVKNFFPYKVKQIVEQLLFDYIAGDEALKIVFEGTEDEYHELDEVCKTYDNIDIERSNTFIENARSILPKIVKIFTEVKPIVDKSISSENRRKEIDRDIDKFTDASNDVVPICVLGNYSSGKSTFINALIGQEILPSGDMPVTAKIYRVAQSLDDQKAIVKLQFKGNPINIGITNEDYVIDCVNGDDLGAKISIELESIKSENLATKVSKCLEVVNNQRADRKEVSDLIDIVIPFRKSPLSESKNSFVIFDTPGSNTATYKDHFDILQDAMKNLSNGVPIYVAEYNSLDSCDNEKLYESIKKISQIDDRFTMIVVNKADMANIKEDSFDKDMEEMILEQAVPRNLYSGGIYFISSIMGLGSKNDGDFIDDHAAEFFEDNERKYIDPRSRRYKQLYKYNIMPQQIKQSICDESEEADNRIFANSGLLAIEHEIVNFAEKYSAYDKCNQSDKYIGNIIDATQEEIDETRIAREEKKRALENELEEEKRELIKLMEEKSNELSDGFINTYDENLGESKDSEAFSFQIDDMRSLENQIKEKQEESHNYSDRIKDLKESSSAILDNFSQVKEKSIGSIAKGVGDDIKDTWDNLWKLRDVRTETDKATADELIEVVTADYNKRLEAAADRLDNNSRDYWENNSREIKRELAVIVTNSSTLDDEKKTELKEIIISYRDLILDREHVFTKDAFEKKVAFFILNKIDLKKLVKRYNHDYSEAIDQVYGRLKDSHFKSFSIWLQQLVDKIRINIVDYNPRLSEQARLIGEETRIIQELEQTKAILQNYKEQIESLIRWETVG